MHALGSGATKNLRRQMWWLRATRWFVLTSFVATAVVLGMFVKLPLLVLEPGPAPDVAKRTRISAETYPSEGSIHLTTAQVKVPEGATGSQILQAIFDPDKIVYPRESIYPSDESPEHTESIQAAQMTQSELEAAVAALSELGMPYRSEGVFVSTISEDSPAADKLIAGDVITAIDSTPVLLVEELRAELAGRAPGATVRLDVVRDGKMRSLAVKTTDPAEGRDGAGLGATLVQYRKAPIEVSISSKDIGGPSAGLIYALSIYDRLVPEDLTGGRTIAGTGTIGNADERSGIVGAVGSVSLKVKGARLIGADVFLVPKGEADEARQAAGSDMDVIGVSTLKEAIAELRKLPPTKIAQKNA